MNQGTTKVLCSCKHEYQDSVYGPQTRVANATQKGDKERIDVRCTVCSKIHTVSAGKVK